MRNNLRLDKNMLLILYNEGQFSFSLPRPVGFTFLGPLSLQITSGLQKCFKNYIPYCSLKKVYQSKSRISNLFNFKDVVNRKLSSHIVYKLMCSCCNTTLYCQTQTYFLLRASEHLAIKPVIEKRPRDLLILIMLLDGHSQF